MSENPSREWPSPTRNDRVGDGDESSSHAGFNGKTLVTGIFLLTSYVSYNVRSMFRKGFKSSIIFCSTWYVETCWNNVTQCQYKEYIPSYDSSFEYLIILLVGQPFGPSMEGSAVFAVDDHTRVLSRPPREALEPLWLPGFLVTAQVSWSVLVVTWLHDYMHVASYV